MTKYINDNPLGKDSIIGGVFFGADMVPSGVFQNVPKYHKSEYITKQEPKLLLTLNKVKYAINKNLKNEKGYEIESTEDLNIFLESFVNLLIDHRDLRNYIFYGSANTEIAYNLNKIIETYPYHTLIAETNNSNDITLSYYTKEGVNYTEIIFPYYNNLNRGDERIIVDNWNKFILDDSNEKLDITKLQVVDKNQRKFDIEKIVTPFQNNSTQLIITDIENVSHTIGANTFNTIKITTLEPLNPEVTEITFDKIFINSEFKEEFYLSYNSKTENIYEKKYEIFHIISDNEFLIRRKGTQFPYENLSIDYIPGDIFGGSIHFGNITTIYAIDKINNYLPSESKMTFTFKGGTLSGVPFSTPTNYKIGDKIKFFEFYDAEEETQIRFKVTSSTGEFFYYNLNDLNEFFIVKDFVHVPNLADRRLDSYEILIERGIKDFAVETITFEDTLPTEFSGKARLFPNSANGERIWTKIVIKGILEYQDLISYNALDGNTYNGFLISPTPKVIADFELGLTPLQKYLLSPAEINNTPWPRRPITNNIMNILDEDYIIGDVYYDGDLEFEFLNWLNNPNLLYKYEFGDNIENDLYSNNLFYEYNLARTIYADETYTNQLIRRAIPSELINEIYDPEFYFGRFILMAGWLFDQIRVYVKFIQYAHTLNYGEYNQLSPELYKYYADHLGLELYEDEDIDFAKLIIQTEPGFYYSSDKNYEENKFFRDTLQKIQFDRQKRLLISLLFLYSIKGTKECIEKMVSLLGAPEGLLTLKEYAFKINNLDEFGKPTNTHSGNMIVDNEKIHVPDFSFEIDVNFLKDKTNINNPINKPYVYKKVYTNDYIYNLRELSINTDVNQAIDTHIDNTFGEMKFNYIRFNKGEFATLQKQEGYLLPLTFPDKYYGFSVEYMIPKNGYKVLTNKNYDEATFNLVNLYEIEDVNVNRIIDITNISIDDSITEAVIETSTVHEFEKGDRVYIFGSEGLINFNKEYIVRDVVSSTKFVISGSFRRDLSIPAITPGKVTLGGIEKLNKLEDIHSTYPLPANFNERNHNDDYSAITDTLGNPLSDFNILKRIYPNSEFVSNKQYILCRIEGHDLVFRVRLKSEVDGRFEERVAIYQNIIHNDGLNHSLRFTFTEEGVEIYKDYVYIGTAKWINPFVNSLNPHLAYEIPKQEILTRLNATINCEYNYYDKLENMFVHNVDYNNLGLDKLKWWDMFIGMPNNLDVFIKKINIYENVTINDYNIGDKITTEDLRTAESYVFQVASERNNYVTYDTNYDIPSIFFKKNPNTLIDFYGYQLPTKLDEFNRNVINGLSLTNKKTQLLELDSPSKISNYKQEFFLIQDYFENNAWVKTIHSDYEYQMFNGKLHELYYLYSNQVLTFKAMVDFLELVEQKFKKLIFNFIPIVINISNFGTLYNNSKYQLGKMRYNNKFCKGLIFQLESLLTTPVYSRGMYGGLVTEGADFEYKLVYNGTEILHSDLIYFEDTRLFTLNKLRNSINRYFELENILGVASIYSELLRIQINKESFFNETGKDTNLLTLVINGSIVIPFTHSIFPQINVIDEIKNDCGDTLVEEGLITNNCGFINYSLPNKATKEIYIWYKHEDKPKTTVHYKSEDSITRRIVKYKNE